MKHVDIAKTVCLLMVGVSAWCVGIEAARYLRTLNAVTAQLPGAISEARGQLSAELAATRADALAAVGSLERTADRRLAAIQGDASRAVETASERVDARLGEVTATVAGIRSDAQPVLAESAATIRDARDTMDALYPDTLALMDTTAVAARSVSETMGAIEKAAPRIAENTAQNAENIAGITHDAHVLTERLTRPKSMKARIWEGVKTVALVARFF